MEPRLAESKTAPQSRTCGIVKSPLSYSLEHQIKFRAEVRSSDVTKYHRRRYFRHASTFGTRAERNGKSIKATPRRIVFFFAQTFVRGPTTMAALTACKRCKGRMVTEISSHSPARKEKQARRVAITAGYFGGFYPRVGGFHKLRRADATDLSFAPVSNAHARVPKCADT
jgi:hypothetical protein